MSIHRSLVMRKRLVRRRNVLTRAERIEKLQADGQWVEGKDSLFGLPKVGVAKMKRRGKGKKKEAEKPAAEA